MTSGGGAKEPEGEGRGESQQNLGGGGGASRILERAGRRYSGGAWLLAFKAGQGRA